MAAWAIWQAEGRSEAAVATGQASEAGFRISIATLTMSLDSPPAFRRFQGRARIQDAWANAQAIRGARIIGARSSYESGSTVQARPAPDAGIQLISRVLSISLRSMRDNSSTEYGFWINSKPWLPSWASTLL